MNYEETIKEIINDEILEIEFISETSNKVYKVKTKNNGNLYVKFYLNNSSHIDNELKIYDLVDNKYLKEIYYKSFNPKVAVFKELIGTTVDELTKEELDKYGIKIIDSVCSYFNEISKTKINGYGILDENLNGKYNDFYNFLNSRQQESSIILSDYKELANLSKEILNKYKTIIETDNSLVPIDTNLKNIMVLNDGNIKFVDPGEMISAPILMAYGDLVAHIYKTKLYELLINKLNLTETEEKLIRIYAIFSSLNILAFLKKLGVNNLKEVIPFGNTYTFYNLIEEHVKCLELKK